MEPKFKAGDVVRLKSGGPQMTVTGVVGEECDVVWFDGAILRDAQLYNDALVMEARASIEVA